MSAPRGLLARGILARLRRGLLGLALAAGAAGAEPAAGAKALLWEVKSATHSVYVFGSMHVARSDFYPLPKAVEDAYRQADELVVEVDISDLAKVSRSIPLLTYAPPDSLDKHVSPQVWKQLEAASSRSRQDVDALKSLRPATLASALVVGALSEHGYDPQAGVLAGLTDDEGDAMLRETLEETQSGELLTNADRLASAWKAGDDEAIARLLREANKDAASQKIFSKLFDERNPAMADKIAALASGPEHALIVIGAGHLAGQNNVLDLLKAKGLQVRRLP